MNLPFHYRATYTKFKCGVATVRIETGRLENLEVTRKSCFNCHEILEDEIHVLFNCPLISAISHISN